MKNKNTLIEKLKSYSAFAGVMVAIPQLADGQIVFNDLPTDIVLDSATSFYALDLNGDGTTDFNFEKGNFPTSSYSDFYDASFRVSGINARVRMEFGFLFYSGCAGAYAYGAGITDAQDNGFWFSYAFIRSGNDAGPQLNFHENLSFLGIRLYSGADYYFGWIRLQINKKEHSLAIRETAYLTIPNVVSYNYGVGYAGNFIDNNEPNESISKATAISNNTVYEASIRASDDEDWYRFEIAAPDNNVKVKMENLPADYDFAIYDEAGIKIGKSKRTGLSNEHEIINGLTDGTYFLKVIPKSEAYDFNNAYTIQVKTSDAPFKLSENEQEVEITKLSVYPNPASEFATIGFTIEKSSDIEITLFDLQGRKIKTIAEGNFSEGNHLFDFSAKDLPKGIYLLQLKTNSAIFSRKLVIQ